MLFKTALKTSYMSLVKKNTFFMGYGNFNSDNLDY